MSKTDELVNQHILEYQSRLKHIDELIAKAHAVSENSAAAQSVKAELSEYKAQRDKLARGLEDHDHISVDNWRNDLIQSSGPMAIWDVLAQKVEDFIERLE